MAVHQQPQLFFHVGLGRTGTTFMQESVFPKFRDIYYINKKGYKRIDEIIAQTRADKYLVSHEFSKKLIDEMRRFSKKYPNAGIIMVLRRQDKWIASHYKRQLKNGLRKDFEEYIDLDNDQGEWKQEHLYYFPKIQCITECFNTQPLILFHHELKDHPAQFVQKIIEYTGVQETDPISYEPVHISYSDRQLKARKWVSQNTIFRELGINNRKNRQLRRLYNKSMRYLILHTAQLIPQASLDKVSLIPEAHLKRIREFYRADWEKCLQYAKENNPV